MTGRRFCFVACGHRWCQCRNQQFFTKFNLRNPQMLLHQRNDIDDLAELGHEDYVLTKFENKPYGLIFKCPGCNQPIAINIGHEHPAWEIDFQSLTASPSIKHSRDNHGCGWHGYLKQGILEGKIE